MNLSGLTALVGCSKEGQTASTFVWLARINWKEMCSYHSFAGKYFYFDQTAKKKKSLNYKKYVLVFFKIPSRHDILYWESDVG